jgi:hypothetical protein
LMQEDHPALKRQKLPREVMLYAVNGPLFFGAAETAMAAFNVVGVQPKVLILDRRCGGIGCPASSLTCAH